MKTPRKVIYDNQIELRLMSAKDGPAIYQGVCESLPELKRFMKWSHFESDLNQACSIYAEFEAKSLRGEEITFAGFDANTGEFLLCCTLFPGSRLNPLAFEIGYWVSSTKTGRGIGTLAAKMLTALAFSEYQANRVSVVCNLENLQSLKVIEKAGFQLEGTLRNYLPQPTSEMLASGYSSVTDAHVFSLVLEDIPSLAWFREFNKKMSVMRFG